MSELSRTWQRDTPELTSRDIVGTLVFADISGFTRLTERLAARGRIGAEEMSDHLDGVLSALLAAAYDHDGWLVKWGGDALLLMFDAPDHARQACAASMAMQSRMRQVGTLDASVGRVKLRMSIGINTGTFSFHLLGHRHRELLITGDAATVTARLEAAAEAGEILLGPATAAIVSAPCLGAAKEGGILLVRAPDGVQARPRRPHRASPVSSLIPPLILHHLASGGGTGEHRQVTVAFLEFSGLSALHGVGGEHAIGEALEQLIDVVQEACHRNGVSFHETDISPDGGKIMLVAGAPRGLEDPAEAMLCTLRQIIEVPNALSLRAGVTAGRAFTGCVGPANRRSYSVKGDVVNLAARVMGKAPTGEIWALPLVTESSRTRFELGEVPRFTVKGKVAPVLVKSVGRPLSRVDAHADLPLIGRAVELAILQSALDRALHGEGQQLDLTGAPGIGKTRLLAELKAAATGMTVLATAAEPYRSSSPYALVGPLLLRACGADDIAAADLPSWLDQWCRDRAPELVSWLPLLRAPLGITLTDTPLTRDLAPEFRAERLRALMLDMLRAAIPGPSLLVVDDMQFVDEASEAVLRHLSRNVTGRPWLIVLAGRTGKIGTGEATGQLESLVVGPLNADESFVFTCAETDDSPLAPHVIAAVVARGGGNPLFLRQLAATAHTTADIADLPDSIETVVAARIDRLLPAARELLRAAAVVGMSIDRFLLAELLEESTDKTSSMLSHLNEFLEADGDELRFRQAVIRDAAYEGLAFRRRARLHGRLAGLLATRPGEDPDANGAVLSLHLLEAGENQQALRVSRAAADRAFESHTNAEAAALYRRALSATSRLSSVEPLVRAELLERLGDIEVRLGEYEPGDRSYAAAARLVRFDSLAVARLGLKRARSAGRQGAYTVALGRLRRVARTLHGIAGTPAADLRVEMAMSTAFTQFRQGRLNATRASCRTVIEHGDERRSPEVVADALALLDLVEMSLGTGVDGLRARDALRLHKRRGDLAGQARVRTQIGYRAYLDGRWNDAVASYAQARVLVERLGDQPNMAIASANIAEIRIDQGRLEEADAALREAIRVWRASGSENDVAFGRSLLGRVLARQGRYDEADALLHQARERFLDQGAKAEVVDTDACRAECLLRRGLAQEALELAESSLVAAGRLSDQPLQAPLLYRVIGASLDALGRTAEGDAAFDLSLDAARRRNAAHEVAFTVAAMAGRARRAGHRVDPALATEVGRLQRRLGLVLDLAALQAPAGKQDASLPAQRSSPGVPVVTS